MVKSRFQKLSAYVLAPISGILTSGATASTTAGTAVASSIFGATIMSLGISALAEAVMVHAGETVLAHIFRTEDSSARQRAASIWR